MPSPAAVPRAKHDRAEIDPVSWLPRGSKGRFRRVQIATGQHLLECLQACACSAIASRKDRRGPCGGRSVARIDSQPAQLVGDLSIGQAGLLRKTQLYRRLVPFARGRRSARPDPGE
jgi:hypothetical protein